MIDGRLYFFDDDSGDARLVVISVKSGNVGVSQVRDLLGVMDNEEAEMGAFLTLRKPTKPMVRAAAEASFYDPPGLLPKVPRLQILTVEEILEGKKLDLRLRAGATFKRAPRRVIQKPVR